HAANADALLRSAAFATPTEITLDVGDRIEDVEAFDELAEDRVLTVEEVRVVGVDDEELAAGRVRVARTRHRQHTALVRQVIELRVHAPTRSAGAGHTAT